MQASGVDADTTSRSVLFSSFSLFSQHFQSLLDKTVPLKIPRWFAFALLIAIYSIRVYSLAGWYIVSYGLGLYLLNQLILFISPKVDPDEETEETLIPNNKDDEFRPFVRRLGEFKFWYQSSRAVLLSLFLTFFEVTNIPVFWPILLVYFIMLFVMTMKKQILHMIKHKYVPFTRGKKVYTNEPSK
eukprot:comp10979_c0_seq1/m.13603 comp10979_c0_seq1/g.13603  ORF comp10979_c0_seq1/g.13603 comp10979_c0_seq1/m.13603 type:complete len:186 (-) comp10979_c0_seq1:79-636(-)